MAKAAKKKAAKKAAPAKKKVAKKAPPKKKTERRFYGSTQSEQHTGRSDR